MALVKARALKMSVSGAVGCGCTKVGVKRGNSYFMTMLNIYRQEPPRAFHVPFTITVMAASDS